MESVRKLVERLLDTTEITEDLVNTCESELNTYINDNFVDITTYKRVAADFENTKKRFISTNEQRLNSFKDNIFTSITEFVDDFDIAIQKTTDKEGITMLREKFVKYLSDNDIVLFYPEENVEKFDVNYHDVISTLPMPNLEDGIIIGCIKCGIKKNENIIRHAQVIVVKN